MKKPFTDKEQRVVDLLVEAHNTFLELEQTHPMEITEWVSNFHKLQDLLGARVLRRDYPETFTSIKNRVKLTFDEYRKLYYIYSSKGMYIDVRTGERISYEDGFKRYEKESLRN